MAYTGVGRPLATYSTPTSTASASTAVFGSNTTKVRAVATTASYVAFGQAASSAGGLYLPADSPEYFTITPGQRVAFIQAGASSGVAFASEVE